MHVRSNLELFGTSASAPSPGFILNVIQLRARRRYRRLYGIHDFHRIWLLWLERGFMSCVLWLDSGSGNWAVVLVVEEELMLLGLVPLCLISVVYKACRHDGIAC